MPDEASVPASPGLKGRMGVTELVFMVLSFNAPIVVVFGYTSFVILFQGVAAPVAYVFVTLLLLLFSAGFARMSFHLPNPGAFYAFVTAGLGREAGLGSAVTAVFGYFLLALQIYIFLGVATSTFIVDVFHGPAIPWYWYTFMFWIAVFIGGYISVEFAVKAIMAGTVLGLLIILAYDVAVLGNGGPEGISAAPLSLRNFSSGSIGLGLLFALLTSLGFESTVIYREEVRDPRRTIPLATYASVVIVGLLYTITTWCLVNAYGTSRAVEVATRDPYRMFPDSLNAYLGKVVVDVGMFLVVVASIAATLAIHNVVTRYCYSLGYDGAFPAAMGRAHARHHSPYVASMIVSAVSLLCLVLFAVAPLDPVLLYARLAGGATIDLLILYFLTAVAVVVYFRKAPANASLWIRLVAPLVAAIGLLAMLGLAMANLDVLMGSSWSLALPALIVVSIAPIGGYALAIHYRSKRPEVFQRIGRNR